MTHEEQTGTTLVSILLNVVVWLTAHGANLGMALLVSTVTFLYMVYRWRANYLRDVRAGINVFSLKRPPSFKSQRDLLAEIQKAQQVGDVAHINALVEMYYEQFLKQHDER